MNNQENKYLVFCETNDFYLGDTIARILTTDRKNCNFFYQELPDINAITLNDTFVSIINPEAMLNHHFQNLVTRLTEEGKGKVILVENEIVEDVPDTWGEIRYINALGGLDKAIIETIEGVSQTPVGIVRNIRKEIEDIKKADHERIERERIEAIERERQAILEAQRAAEEERKIYLRKYSLNTFEELIIKVPNCSPNVTKGIKYLIGDGLPVDSHRAVAILEKEVKEHPEDMNALYHLGICYFQGYGNLSDEEYFDKMIEIFGKVKDYGYENAYILLSQILLHKTGVTTESEKVINEFSKINKVSSQYYAGLLDELNGNYQAALEKYYEAAEEGFAPAQNAVGYMYGEGWIVNQDINKAQQWFEMAANQGLIEADFNLGYIMFNFYEDDHTRAEGAKKMQRLLETGHEKAIQIYNIIKKKYNKQQQAEERKIRNQEIKDEIIKCTMAFGRTMFNGIGDIIRKRM